MNWTNPVYPYYFADPFVWKHEGRYYAVGTGPISESPAAGEADFTTYEVNGREMARVPDGPMAPWMSISDPR